MATNVIGSFGSLRINADGSYTYTVDNSNTQVRQLTGSSPFLNDVFTYTLTDTGGLQSTTQITIRIRGVNDTPTAAGDTATAVEAGGISNATLGINPSGNLLS
ncbi:MAG: VCBS domain-containing protein, partial [Phycisphaerae bacterium]